MADIKFYQVSGIQKTNSKNVADAFQKPHRTVLAEIKRLDCGDNFRLRNFAHSSYTSPQNKTHPCVEMTVKGFYFLVLGFTGKKAAQHKEDYINEFFRMSTPADSASDA